MMKSYLLGAVCSCLVLVSFSSNVALVEANFTYDLSITIDNGISSWNLFQNNLATPVTVENFDGTVQSVSAVPDPTAVWLFGSGLIGLVGMVRHKKTV